MKCLYFEVGRIEYVTDNDLFVKNHKYTLLKIFRTIYYTCYGGVCGIMNVIQRYGHGDLSSIPGQDSLHFT